MIIHVLTQEQQDFAAEHHDLIYDFLRDNRLLQDEFYDVVVFGYLHAVRRYLVHERLRRQVEFDVLARRAMMRDLAVHCKAARTCSASPTWELRLV